MLVYLHSIDKFALDLHQAVAVKGILAGEEGKLRILIDGDLLHSELDSGVLQDVKGWVRQRQGDC